MYQGRLAQLSLNANVHLKLLPPIVEVEAATSAGHGPWWEEIKELERVLRMYSTHRLRNRRDNMGLISSFTGDRDFRNSSAHLWFFTCSSPGRDHRRPSEQNTAQTAHRLKYVVRGRPKGHHPTWRGSGGCRRCVLQQCRQGVPTGVAIRSGEMDTR